MKSNRRSFLKIAALTPFLSIGRFIKPKKHVIIDYYLNEKDEYGCSSYRFIKFPKIEIGYDKAIVLPNGDLEVQGFRKQDFELMIIVIPRNEWQVEQWPSGNVWNKCQYPQMPPMRILTYKDYV